MGRFRSKLDLMTRTRRLCNLGAMPEPPWLKSVQMIEETGLSDPQTRALQPQSGRRRVKRLVFPEDRYLQSYLDRNPQGRMQPVDLSSSEPPLSRQYALRHMELRSSGMAVREARDLLDQQFPSADSGTVRQQGLLARVQREEERILLEAMEQLHSSASSQSSALGFGGAGRY